MTNKEIIELSKAYLTPNYGRLPLAIVKGKGSSVWDADGKKYLDFVSGLAVTNLGHSFTPVTKAVQKQLSKLGHVSNLYYSEPQAQLAKALVDRIYKGKVFFCNSGAEANEAALKLARRHSVENHGKSRTEIIAFEGSFHGRTMGALSMTHSASYKEGFGPELPGVKHVPLDDLKAVEKAMTRNTCAVIMEPVQGESGVRMPKVTFVQKLAKLCAAKNVLLVFDEVQTGFGRTGKLFAYERYKVRPDIITMAKGIANGLPMGAMFVKEQYAKTLGPGAHATTFGGHPALCAGALVALEEISKPETLENATDMGRYMALKLTQMKNSIPSIKEVRGLGLMVGLELVYPCQQVVEKCAQLGLLINCANQNTLRFLPPLMVKKSEVDKALNIVGKILSV